MREMQFRPWSKWDHCWLKQYRNTNRTGLHYEIGDIDDQTYWETDCKQKKKQSCCNKIIGDNGSSTDSDIVNDINEYSTEHSTNSVQHED